MNIFAHARHMPKERVQVHVGPQTFMCRYKVVELFQSNKNKQKIRRIIEYFLNTFTCSKHIIIIGRVSILSLM